ncbi:MAG TPA: STAS/SEC14 domain-containing protein [Candidatus Saccharimonadales bacterium]|nr:STAS/SEC14 domain-containing protein [Candidatus Saccharimonadales bacterium]
MQDKKLFRVSAQDGYILSRLWGDAGSEEFEESADEVLALRKQKHIDRLLCDIRELNPVEEGIKEQARSIGTLWKMRDFKKIAFLLEPHLTESMAAALAVSHLTNRCQVFEDEAEAAAWLKTDE